MVLPSWASCIGGCHPYSELGGRHRNARLYQSLKLQLTRSVSLPPWLSSLAFYFILIESVEHSSKLYQKSLVESIIDVTKSDCLCQNDFVIMTFDKCP